MTPSIVLQIKVPSLQKQSDLIACSLIFPVDLAEKKLNRDPTFSTAKRIKNKQKNKQKKRSPRENAHSYAIAKKWTSGNPLLRVRSYLPGS